MFGAASPNITEVLHYGNGTAICGAEALRYAEGAIRIPPKVCITRAVRGDPIGARRTGTDRSAMKRNKMKQIEIK